MGSLMNTPLLFSSIVNNRYQKNFWQNLRSEASDGGKFLIDLSIKYNPNRFVSRSGEWSLPWKQDIPDKYNLPNFDSSFNIDYDTVTNIRAEYIKNLINNENQKFALMYSGGIDSTLALSALIKNLNKRELKNIVICLSRQSIVENPTFYKKFIWNKFKTIESLSVKYDDLIERGYRPITADEGDCIFGTIFGLDFFQHYDYYVSLLKSDSRNKFIRLKKDVETRCFEDYKELIIEHFKVKKGEIETDIHFPELWYRKMLKNIQTSNVPVYTLYDFFWWQIFNLKYVNCAMRCSIYLNDRLPVRNVVDKVINWFNSDEYQLWSMVNNNNGEKIQALGVSTYKMASRKYIYDLDKNPWYFYYKLKLPSLGGSVTFSQDLSKLTVGERPNARFGLDRHYNVLYIDDMKVKNFIRESILNYRVDW